MRKPGGDVYAIDTAGLPVVKIGSTGSSVQ
jgi:hypothetical protein